MSTCLTSVGPATLVHYVAYNGVHLAALVTHVDAPFPEKADLAVFTALPNVNGQKSGGLQFHFDIPYSQEPAPGTWHLSEVPA